MVDDLEGLYKSSQCVPRKKTVDCSQQDQYQYHTLQNGQSGDNRRRIHIILCRTGNRATTDGVSISYSAERAIGRQPTAYPYHTLQNGQSGDNRRRINIILSRTGSRATTDGVSISYSVERAIGRQPTAYPYHNL